MKVSSFFNSLKCQIACAMVTRSASGVADDVIPLTKLIAVTDGLSKNSEKQKAVM